MDRRDFLKFSGAAFGGMLLPVSTVRKVAYGVSQRKPEFTLLTTPSLDIDVLIGEHKFGSISGDIFSPFVASLKAEGITGSCPNDVCPPVAKMPDKEETPINLMESLTGMPFALLPLLAHPISNIYEVEDDYSMSGFVLPRPEIKIKPEEYLPMRISPQAGGRIGPYMWFLYIDEHFVGGCIKRYLKHVNVKLKYWETDQVIFNLHICGWWEDSRPCFGVYNSANRWCWKTCTWNSWSAIYSLVLAAASVYVADWVASTLAAAVATAAVGALTAIPGVPPPP
nr:twin-arginine translocation signal domain-containing protein [Ardenticatena sp.]